MANLNTKIVALNAKRMRLKRQKRKHVHLIWQIFRLQDRRDYGEPR